MSRFAMNFEKRLLRVVGTAVILTITLLAISTTTTLAHTRVEVGPYTIVVGWLVEPPVVGERNALTIEITEDGEPVSGAEDDLRAELVYGAQTFRTNLNPTEESGLYTATIFPTVRGQYAVRLFGTLNGLEIDETIEPEEVFSADRIQFPEPLPDTRELQKQITTLENDVQTTRNFSFIAIAIGMLGLVVAIVAIVKSRNGEKHENDK